MTTAIRRSQTPIREMTGRPGQSWGYIVIPARGKVTMRIRGDVLDTTITTTYGLENRHLMTRIQRIETVEMIEGRLWWLLGIGIPLLFFFFLGLIPIVLFFFLKQKWLIVHNASGNLLLFYDDSQRANSFCQTLMAVARQLNSKSTPATAANGGRPKRPVNQRSRSN